MPTLLKRLPLSWAIGLSLFSGRSRSRVSVATIVSVVSIGVGVAVLTAVLAVTGGFEEAFRERILGVYPHMVVLARGERFEEYRDVADRLARLPGVAGTNPSTYDEMMVSSDTGSAGAIVKGVDIEGVDRVSSLTALTTRKSLAGLAYRDGEPLRAVLGCELARRLEVGPGDRVTLTTPVRGLGDGPGPIGMAPMQRAFVVEDCFESGFWEYDSRLVVMDLASAQAFLDRGPAVRWIELRLDDMFDTERMRRSALVALSPYGVADLARDSVRVREIAGRAIESALPDGATDVVSLIRAVRPLRRALDYADFGMSVPRYRVIDWKEMNRNLFGALGTQKAVLALFFLIIVLVAAFNIVGTQLIVARERVREVSTLVALGASRRQLARVFVAHGFALGLAGVAAGLAAGYGIVSAIRGLDFRLDPRVYLITELPASLHWDDALTIAAVSAAVVLVSCVLSSWRATRLNPVDGLRKVA
ncbi:MAG: ABC transporter permease [Deltaproteobacteria bacterium]|nr:ABC transporter permease [Deltaproteobacteria bacterium]